MGSSLLHFVRSRREDTLSTSPLTLLRERIERERERDRERGCSLALLMAASSIVNRLLIFSNCSSSSSSSSQSPFVSLNESTVGRRRSLRGALLQAHAKKKNSKSKADRFDQFFFPEAVLLKKETVVNEEGQAMPEFADAEEEKLYQALSLELESSLKLERMRHYEVVFLIHEKYDPQVEEIVTKVEDFIREKKGRIWRLNDWGLRRLAYEVKKTLRAHYILMNFEIDARFVNDFKTMLDKDERVIRHLVSKQDKAETEYCPPPIEYHTLLARQGFVHDKEFWDDDDETTMYDDDEDDDDNDEEEDYEDYGDAVDDEADEEVIYVDEDEDHDENKELVRKIENVSG